MEQVLYSLPDGWEWLGFDSLVENLDGKRIPIKTSERSKDNAIYPYYGATGIIDYVDDYIYEGEKLLISEDGANLVARKYPIAFLADGKYWVNNHAHVVDAYKDKTSNKYLSYFFAVLDLSSFITGSAQPKLSQKKLNSIKVAVAPIAEQKRIVEKLDAFLTRIDTAIEHLQESVTLADALYASLLDQAFNPKSPSSNEDGTNQLPNGWRKVPLGTIVELSQGTQIPVGDQFVEQDEGFIRFLRISDFVRYDEPPRYILYPGPQYIVQEDDVCMIRYGDAGRAVTGLAGALANNLFKISPNEMLSKRFLFLQLQSPRCVEYLRASNNSSTMPAISFKAVNAMEFNLPPLDEQQQIIEKLNNANKLYLALKGLFENKIRYFNDLKASILDSAFKGEL